LDSKVYTIVGVLPPSFEFGLVGPHIDVWAPQIDHISLFTPENARSGVCYRNAVGRLGPGMTKQQAQAQMDVLQQRYIEEFSRMPDADSRNVVRLIPLKAQLVGKIRPTLFLLFSAVAMLLLITCVNVSGLLLARSAARRREIAIRTALGASRK